jgi:hypothetical protein
MLTTRARVSVRWEGEREVPVRCSPTGPRAASGTRPKGSPGSNFIFLFSFLLFFFSFSVFYFFHNFCICYSNDFKPTLQSF